MATLQDKDQCFFKYDATKPDVKENRIRESIDRLNTTLSSDMTSLQAKVASARIVGRERNVPACCTLSKCPYIQYANTCSSNIPDQHH